MMITKYELIRLYEDDKTIGPSYCALRSKKWTAVMMINLKMTKNEDDNGDDKKYRAFILCLRRDTQLAVKMTKNEDDKNEDDKNEDDKTEDDKTEDNKL